MRRTMVVMAMLIACCFSAQAQTSDIPDQDMFEMCFISKTTKEITKRGGYRQQRLAVKPVRTIQYHGQWLELQDIPERSRETKPWIFEGPAARD